MFYRPLARRNQFPALWADVSLSADTPDHGASRLEPSTVGGFTEAICLVCSQRTQVSKTWLDRLKSRLGLAK